MSFYDYKPSPSQSELAEESQSGGTKQEGQSQGTEASLSFSDQVWQSSSGSIALGKKVFSINCAVCHGASGRGDGVAGKSLKPPPTNFVRGEWKKGGGSIQIFKSINEGVQGSSMASFKHIPLKERWALVHFIRSITENKEQDDLEKLKSFSESIKE